MWRNESRGSNRVDTGREGGTSDEEIPREVIATITNKVHTYIYNSRARDSTLAQKVEL